MRRQYNEASFQTDFGKYLRHMRKGENATYELKVSDTDMLNFHRLEDHQLAALYASKHSSLYFKIPDDSRGQKPFDCFQISKSKAFIVVMFRCKDIGQKTFYMIDVDEWEKETGTSLTEQRASEIGITCQLK